MSAPIAKLERHELELAVFNGRHDVGGRAVYDWLKYRRDEINARWMNLAGEELSAAQGEAKGIARLIKLVEQGPAIKTERKDQ